MELKVFRNKKGNALYYMKSVRKPGHKHPTKAKVAFLGYEEDLKKLYDDPVAHFQQELEQMKQQRPDEPRTVVMHINLDEHYAPDGSGDDQHPAGDLACMGQLPLSRIYHELEIDQFVNNRRDKWGIKANADTIFKTLVFGRILFPDSKLGTWQERGKLMLGNSDFSDDDLYRSLAFFDAYREDLVVHLNQKVGKLYARDASLMFYDVTNYFWEIDDPDCDIYDDSGTMVASGLRKRGCSKEHRPEPIVQMGLFMDADGLPVDFGLFPGNNNDVTTFIPMIRRTREKLGLDKMIYVADKGMMSGTNVANILAERQGYIISDSVRKLDGQTRRFVLDEEGYVCHSERIGRRELHEQMRLMDCSGTIGQFTGADGSAPVVTYKYKSRLVPATETTWVSDGTRKVRVQVNKRQIVFWSRKYQVRARIERAAAILKAFRTGTVFNGHGANKFFRKDAYDKQTGELLEKTGHIRYLDMDLIASEEAMDGYYLIETNVVGTCADEKPWVGKARFRPQDCLFELNRPVTDQQIIDMYRGLWKIEETFKVTKSHLQARPVFVRKEDSIHAHFLSCFVALLLIRILEVKKLRGQVPYSAIIDVLRRAQVGLIHDNIYKNFCSDPLLSKIGVLLGLDLSKKFYTKQELRSLNNKTKYVL